MQGGMQEPWPWVEYKKNCRIVGIPFQAETRAAVPISAILGGLQTKIEMGERHCCSGSLF
jgi:hypothetical protein